MKADLKQILNSPDHAKYGPSSFKRIYECPASVFLGRNLPDNPPTTHSIAGRRAHSVAAAYLEAKLEGDPFPEERFQDKKYTDEMKIHAASYAKFCYRKIKKYLHLPHFWYIETKAVLDEKRDIWGTPDFFFIYRENNTLNIIVIDYKYGENIEVESVDNWQLELYVLCIIASYGYKYPVETATCFIFQPRTDHAPPPITYQASYLLNERLPVVQETVDLSENWFKEGKISKEDKKKYQKAGDHCQFCKVKPVCAVYDAGRAEKTTKIVNRLIKTLGPKKDQYSDVETAYKVGALSAEEIAYLALNRSKIINVLNNIPRTMIALAAQGKEFPGAKVVESTDKLQLIDDEAALEEGLKNLGIKHPYRMVKKFLSRTEIEALVGKDKIKHLVRKVGTNYKIVPESHKLPAVKFGLDISAMLRGYFNKEEETGESEE